MLDHHESLVEHDPCDDQPYIQYIGQNRSKAHDQASYSISLLAIIVISIDLHEAEDSQEF